MTHRLYLIIESGTDVRLIEGLAQHFALSVIARQVPGGKEISWPPLAEIEVTRGPASRLAFAAFVASRLARPLRQPCAVLVQGYGLAALIANLLSRLTGRPTVMLVCSPAEQYYRCRSVNADNAKPFRRWELDSIRLVASLNAHIGRRYVVLSEYLRGVVHTHGVSPQRIGVIPVYGVDTRIFSPATEGREPIRRRLGLPLAEPIIFFSSRVAPEKDSSTLIMAVARLAQDGVPARLLHLSDSSRDFQALAARHGVGDRVIARDAVHPHRELPAFYHASDVCVQASLAEGLGFSPLEALACEVPVVASAVGGLVETIIPGVTGWTYPAGDAVALELALREVLANPEGARARAKSGRMMVVDRYEQRVAFQQLASCFS